MLGSLSTVPASGRLDSYGRAHPLGRLKPLNFFLFFSEIFHSCARTPGSGPGGRV